MDNNKLLNILWEFKTESKDDFIERGLDLLGAGYNSGWIDSRVLNIENVVCEYLGINSELLYQKSNKMQISEARFIVWHFSRKKYSNISLRYLAGLYNMKNHTSILHGLKEVKNRYELYKDFIKKIDDIEKLLKLVYN